MLVYYVVTLMLSNTGRRALVQASFSIYFTVSLLLLHFVLGYYSSLRIKVFGVFVESADVNDEMRT